jgi:peptidoglycan-associated lipoprotein
MSRKSLLWVGMLLVLPVLVGCPKKAPTTPNQTLAVETTPVAPAKEIPPPPPPAPPADIEENTLPSDLVDLNRAVVERGLIGDVFFAFDKSDLSDESRQRLADNAAFMRAGGPSGGDRYQFTIEGHCDERGTNEYNLALGQRRASAAREYLASLGIDASRLTTISYGEERPFCPQSDEGCWAKNRRAHFVITSSR